MFSAGSPPFLSPRGSLISLQPPPPHTCLVPPLLNLPVLPCGEGETSGVRTPAAGQQLRLDRDQALWEIRTERPVIRLPPWHPSLPAGLSFPLASSILAPPPAAVWACPQISDHAGPRTEKRWENLAGRMEAWKKCLGRCCLHTAQGGQLRPELAAGPPLWGSLGVTGPWVVTGDLGSWHSSSPETPRPPCHRSISHTCLDHSPSLC